MRDKNRQPAFPVLNRQGIFTADKVHGRNIPIKVFRQETCERHSISSYNHGTKVIRHGDPIKLNFGGFVPLSTIDWRGRSVCSVFLRGCPLRCSYCQNEAIQSGEDYREIEEVFEMIHSSSPFISGVMFSGGEPTMQREGLTALARYVQKLKLSVGIQTNGFFPDTLEELLSNGLVNKIAVDYKTTWEGYSGVTGGYYPSVKENYERNVLKSIGICQEAVENKKLNEFEVVFTIFYENQSYLLEISRKIGKAPLVLQQGEHKMPVITPHQEMTTGEYIFRKRIQQERHPPLTLQEIKGIADKLEKKVRIRTREIGEISYEGRRRRRTSRKR